ncbi:MAG: SPFH domain-containing protein, partial [Gemmatimonadaceae bacterium]
LTPEEVNEDRLGFARHLSEEADHDLKKLGLQLDVLKIQHVSDRVGYLKAMGEKATSEAIRDAEIAKANAQAETALRQAEATRVAEVATAEAATSIAEAQNLLRVRRAELSREAETAERVAKAEAERAEAEARTRLELQRVDLERTRLQADVVQPAEAARMAAESRAKADAAPILENGRAQAEALRMILAEIHAQGETGIRVFMAEKLPALLASALESMATIDIDRVTVIDSGGGQGVANATTQKVNASLAAVQQVANSMGLDMEGIIQNLARAQITSGADKSKEGK